MCFAAQCSDNSSLLAVCILYNSHAIFAFLLQRSVLGDLRTLHEGSKLPILLHTAIVLHRNHMFQDLLTLGLGIEDEYLFPKCCHIAIESCNWDILEILLGNSRCSFGPENVSAALLFTAANSLHAPSVLRLLQALRARCGAEYVKKCVNMITPKGLSILNVIMLLIRSCERDSSTACNSTPSSPPPCPICYRVHVCAATC